MNPHRTQPIEIRPGRRSRRRAAQRRRLRQHLMASAALAFLAAMLVLFLSQPMEPPLVEATLPDKPEPEEEVVNDEGFVLDRESVLAPVAAESRSRGPESAAQRLSRPGGSGSTGEPPPSISAIPAPPAGGPAELRSGDHKLSPAPAEDVDDEPPPPPVTTAPPVAVDEELTRPGTEPVVDPVCWSGWTYDESRRECVREDDDPEPADRNEDAEEEERPEETTEPGVGSDLGGVSKGTGIGKNVEVTR